MAGIEAWGQHALQLGRMVLRHAKGGQPRMFMGLLLATFAGVMVLLAGCIDLNDSSTPREGAPRQAGEGEKGAGEADSRPTEPGFRAPAAIPTPSTGDRLIFAGCEAVGWQVQATQEVFPYVPPAAWTTSPFILAPEMEGVAHRCEEVVVGNLTVARQAGLCLQYHSNLTAPDDAWDEASYGKLALPLDGVTDSQLLHSVLTSWGLAIEYGNVSLDPAPTGIESSKVACDGGSRGFSIAADHATTTTESAYGFPYVVRVVTNTSEDTAWISTKADRRSTQLAPGHVVMAAGETSYWGDSAWSKWPVQHGGVVKGVQVFSHLEAQWTWTYKGTGVE